MASSEDRCSNETKDTGSATAVLDAGTDVTAAAMGTGSEPVSVGLKEEGPLTASRANQRRRGSKLYGVHSWRKCWSNVHRASRRLARRTCESTASSSQSNSQPPSATDSSMAAVNFDGLSGHFAPLDTNVSADELAPQLAESPSTAQSDAATSEAATSEAAPSDPPSAEQLPVETPFANIEVVSAAPPDSIDNVDAERASGKSVLANVIEKAILDFCSSRTVEAMRRMFAGVTSELEATQGDAGRGGDKFAQAPHPVTADLVKEGIVIGSMDVFAPRVHREYRLEMKDSLVEGFLKEVGVFRSICYRTKCQLEVTRRLLNKKLCSGGRWVKYLIVRIVGPSLRAISCCDSLLQKAVPAFKSRIEYPKAAYCRFFFREDIPDNALLYNSYQRTGGTSNRYGLLKLETPYRLTSERTVGNCPWKSGSLRVGKLSFAGSGAHLCMRQVYPGYGYTDSNPVGTECKGVEALHRIEQMHGEFLTKRQELLVDRRAMTLPVCR